MPHVLVRSWQQAEFGALNLLPCFFHTNHAQADLSGTTSAACQVRWLRLLKMSTRRHRTLIPVCHLPLNLLIHGERLSNLSFYDFESVAEVGRMLATGATSCQEVQSILAEKGTFFPPHTVRHAAPTCVHVKTTSAKMLHLGWQLAQPSQARVSMSCTA